MKGGHHRGSRSSCRWGFEHGSRLLLGCPVLEDSNPVLELNGEGGKIEAVEVDIFPKGATDHVTAEAAEGGVEDRSKLGGDNVDLGLTMQGGDDPGFNGKNGDAKELVQGRPNAREREVRSEVNLFVLQDCADEHLVHGAGESIEDKLKFVVNIVIATVAIYAIYAIKGVSGEGVAELEMRDEARDSKIRTRLTSFANPATAIISTSRATTSVETQGIDFGRELEA